LTSFINILPFVRKWEGGEVFFPTENQWTNRGVQWNTYKVLAPKLLGIPNPTVEGLRSMTEAQGDKFIEYFWNKATFNNSITNQATANAFFEMLWGGGSYGIKWLQKKIGVYPDGSVGPKTVAMANKFDPETILNEVLKRFKYLAFSNPAKYAFALKGWTNRFNDLYAKSKIYFASVTDDLLKEIPESKKKSKIVLFLLGGLAVSYIIYKKINK
jgi:lysozyme family protein